MLATANATSQSNRNTYGTILKILHFLVLQLLHSQTCVSKLPAK